MNLPPSNKRTATGDFLDDANKQSEDAYGNDVHNNAAASRNSFSDNEMHKTPHGSIHTKHNFDVDDNRSFTSNPMTSGPTQFTYKSNTNNKIRVVIRMRPYLDNEYEVLQQ